MRHFRLVIKNLEVLLNVIPEKSNLYVVLKMTRGYGKSEMERSIKTI